MKTITVHTPTERENIVRISPRLPLQRHIVRDWEHLIEVRVVVDKIVYFNDDGIQLVTDDFLYTSENAQQIEELLK